MTIFIVGFIIGFLLAAWLAHFYLHSRINDLEDSLHARIGRFDDAMHARMTRLANVFTRRPDAPPSCPQPSEATTTAPAGAAESPPAAAPAG